MFVVVTSVVKEGGERFQSYQPHLAPVVIAFYLIFLKICVLCSPDSGQSQSGVRRDPVMNVERVESFRTSLMTQKQRLLKQTQVSLSVERIE